jgi:chemotaxis protein histidine kinase CheA
LRRKDLEESPILGAVYMGVKRPLPASRSILASDRALPGDPVDPSRYLPLYLDAARALAQGSGAGPPGEALSSRLARHLHSLKGIAACLRYRSMTRLAHTAEEALGAWKRAGGAVPARAHLLAALASAERMLRGAERLLKLSLPERWSVEIRLAQDARVHEVLQALAAIGTVPASDSHRNRLSLVLSSTLKPQEVAAGLARVPGVERFFLEPETVPFRHVVRPLVGATSVAARMLGKRVRFQVEGQGVRLDRRRASALLEALVHVLRNAVDHGIEPPRERVLGGKRRSGTIRIRAEKGDRAVRVTVEDDGRGFPVPRPHAVTAGRAGEVSGRGVGLPAARDALVEVGGVLTIRARSGRGATVEMAVPL